MVRKGRSDCSQARSLRNSMTYAEKTLWSKIRGKQLGVKFRRQHPFGFYVLDFYCVPLKLAIEVDGNSHFTDEGRKHDSSRDEFLYLNDVKLLRFTNLEVIQHIDSVLERIWDEVNHLLQS